MRILLVGTGYVGMALLSLWKGESDRFLATTTTDSKLQEIQAKKIVEHSILLTVDENTDLKPLLEQCDGVIVTVAPKQGASYKETYLDTALSLSRALKGRKKPLFLLYTSSTSVYGNQKGKRVDETSIRTPISENSKLLSEVEDIFLACASLQIDVCIARLGGIYGPFRTLGLRARRLSQKEMGGSGQEPTNHIHLEDVTHAIEFCVRNRLTGVYNFVNEDHPDRKTLYDNLCREMSLDPPVWQTIRSSFRGTNALISNEKIKKAGYSFKHPHIAFSPG